MERTLYFALDVLSGGRPPIYQCCWENTPDMALVVVVVVLMLVVLLVVLVMLVLVLVMLLVVLLGMLVLMLVLMLVVLVVVLVMLVLLVVMLVVLLGPCGVPRRWPGRGYHSIILPSPTRLYPAISSPTPPIPPCRWWWST